MKAPHLALGQEGEQAAEAWLKKLGYRILARNWRSAAPGLKALELDLVCREGDALVFVEVKTRSLSEQNRPLHGFSPAKRQRLQRAAQAWLEENRSWHLPCRFDLVCVSRVEGQFNLELIRNVIQRDFMAGGNASWQPW